MSRPRVRHAQRGDPSRHPSDLQRNPADVQRLLDVGIPPREVPGFEGIPTDPRMGDAEVGLESEGIEDRIGHHGLAAGSAGCDRNVRADAPDRRCLTDDVATPTAGRTTVAGAGAAIGSPGQSHVA